MNILTVTAFLLLSQWVISQTTYCPSTNDLQPGWGSSGVTINNQGWRIVGTSGGGAASTKASYNLLGGWVSYTMNLASVNYYVNANLYAIFPSGLGSAGFPWGTSSSAPPYCDGQGPTGSIQFCPELDFAESNGNCGCSSTLHTEQGDTSGCDKGGCALNYDLTTSTLNYNISFNTNGQWTVVLNGVTKTSYNRNPSSNTWNVIANHMNSRGAVLYSSLWQGWSPDTPSCTSGSQPWGRLDTSSFTVTNLRIHGKIVQGPTPTVCSGSPPSPPTTTTTTTKAPTTTTKAPTTKAPTTAPSTPAPAPSSGAPTKYDKQALGSWTNGRSTYYGVGNGGNCGYGNLPTDSFSWGLIAAANGAYYNNAEACGQCFEIYCVSSWNSNIPNYCENGKSVIVQVTDQCPAGDGWCSGDMVHFDLSTSAFSKIVKPDKIGTVGVIKTKYRRTACPASGNIKITNQGGNSQWYLAWYFTNVASYGGLTSVQITCGSSTYTMTRQPYNAWVYSGNIQQAPNTCAIKIKDSAGTVLTSNTGIINSWSATSIDFGKNFANPSGTIYTQSAESTGPESAPVITITVIVVGVVVLILIVALIMTLRSKKRRESVAYRSDSVALPKETPTKEGTSTELVASSTLDASADKPRENFEDTRQQLAQAVEAATSATQQPTDGFEGLKLQDWEQRKDEQGQTYFYNTKTGVSQWETPDDLATTETA